MIKTKLKQNNYFFFLSVITPLKNIINPKLVKNNESNSINETIPITGRSKNGSWREGSFNDFDGKVPENIKTSKMRIAVPKNIRLPPKLITTYQIHLID